MRAEEEGIVTIGDEVWQDEARVGVLRRMSVNRNGRPMKG